MIILYYNISEIYAYASLLYSIILCFRECHSAEEI